MRRLSALLVLVALGAGVYFLPPPAAPAPDPAPPTQPLISSVCPVSEGSGRSTEVAVASTLGGSSAITLFAGGSTVGSLEISLGEDGAVIMPVVDIAAVGTVGGLVELPGGQAAAGSRTRGPASTTLEACVREIPTRVVATGGSTVSGGELTLHLMNPFAGDAVATLVVHSDAGLEASDRFTRVIVPSRGSNVITLNNTIPGRDWVTVRVEVTRGRVVAALRQTVGDRAMSWNAVEPGTSWLVPVPTEVEGRLVIAGADAGQVEYQVDVYGPDGVTEALVSGELAEGEMASIPLADLEGARAARVVATGPIVTTLQLTDGTKHSATTGAPAPAGSWLLPAASTGSARLVILNPELEDASVVIRAMREDGREFRSTVAAESVLETSLDGADAYLVDSDVPIVVLLYEAGEMDDALAMGTPIEDE
jgi:hypothetical protein